MDLVEIAFSVVAFFWCLWDLAMIYRDFIDHHKEWNRVLKVIFVVGVIVHIGLFMTIFEYWFRFAEAVIKLVG